MKKMGLSKFILGFFIFMDGLGNFGRMTFYFMVFRSLSYQSVVDCNLLYVMTLKASFFWLCILNVICISMLFFCLLPSLFLMPCC